MKRYLILLTFILSICSQIAAQKVIINGVNFSLFEGSDGYPTSSYENGKMEISIDQSWPTSVLLITYYSSTGKEIVCRGFTTDALYGYSANEIVKPLRVRDVYIFKENYSGDKSMAFQVSQLTINPVDEPFLPMAIYMQIFVNDSLFLSSTVEYSTQIWNELTSLLKKYQKYL